ncbi:MAG: N-acetylmuramic acid 6-phosphate etherase [Gemmatimonadetes bacterium]|nr:N-acetylmuramic acid 6-phosphate etherase [Gemmatimonadota bacterium]
MTDLRLTEQRNPRSADLDTLGARALVGLINDEDAGVASAVADVLDDVALAVELAESALRAGGRLVYVGAGTSGRLGVLDAAEMPPTFGADPDRVIGVIAGGHRAIVRACEGAEDHPEEGGRAMDDLRIGPTDFVLGIATSGTTPYVHGALDRARARRARTGFLLCTPPESELVARHDVVIAPLVGPEVVTGSTRMKAGTATKMVLNALSTAVMVRLGKVHGNLMVDLRVTCRKLRDRAQRIITEVTGCSASEARDLLERAAGEVKTALVMASTEWSAEEARDRLEAAGGIVARVIDSARSEEG